MKCSQNKEKLKLAYKTKPLSKGISRRKGWPLLLDTAFYIEGAVGSMIAPEDKQIFTENELELIKKDFPRKINDIEQFCENISRIFELQVLHQVVYTEFHINLTNFIQCKISPEKIFTVLYRSLQDKKGMIKGYYSIVPELNREVEENIFLEALEYSKNLYERGWIYGISINGRGDIPLDLYFDKLNGTKLLISLNITGKINRLKLLKEISRINVKRIHYIMWLNDILKSLRKNDIAIQISPTMDTSLSSYFTLNDYPFIDYFRKGYKVIVASGYPEIFGRTIENEFVLMKSSFGMNLDEIKKISLDSSSSIFCSEEDRELIISEILNKA